MSSTKPEHQQKFEYKTVSVKSLKNSILKSGKISEDKLNELGENGWQLMGTAGERGGTSQFIFMRPAGVYPEESSGWFS